MRTSVLLSLLLLVGAASAQNWFVQILSPSQNLIAFSGFEAASKEARTPTQAHFNVNKSVIVKNVSNKTVISMWVRVNTDTTEIISKHEHFFKDHGIAAGDTIEIAIPELAAVSTTNTSLGLTTTVNTPGSPNISAELLFVQFEDGTSWGDEKSAANVHAERAAMEAYLKHVSAAYQQAGEAAMVTAMNENVDTVTDSVQALRAILMQSYKAGGISAALDQLNHRLQNAANRKATGKQY